MTWPCRVSTAAYAAISARLHEVAGQRETSASTDADSTRGKPGRLTDTREDPAQPSAASSVYRRDRAGNAQAAEDAWNTRAPARTASLFAFSTKVTTRRDSGGAATAMSCGSSTSTGSCAAARQAPTTCRSPKPSGASSAPAPPASAARSSPSGGRPGARIRRTLTLSRQAPGVGRSAST
jgi:hypothetical protein